MKQWKPEHIYQSPDGAPDINSLSFSYDSTQVIGGTTTGEILLFEMAPDGKWSLATSWQAVKETIDPRSNELVDASIVDTDFFPIERKCPMCVTAGKREMRLWFVSDYTRPKPDPEFKPKGFSFPKIAGYDRIIQPNEVAFFASNGQYKFTSVRANPDGLSFGYTEGSKIYIRKVDRIDPAFEVFSSDAELTKLDYNPTNTNLILAADETGRAGIIDLRIQPHQNKPVKSARAYDLIGQKPVYISDCKYSSNGTDFYTRQYTDLIFWDSRNTAKCVKRAQLIHEAEIPSEPYCPNGKKKFDSCWLDSKVVSTGSYNGLVYNIGENGNASKTYVTTTASKEGKSIFKSKVRQIAAKRCVGAISINQKKNKVVASNGGNIIIYSIV